MPRLKFEITRGRPSKANVVKICIMEILTEMGAGSPRSIMHEIGRRTNKTFSWNTVKKYCDDLVNEHKINVHVLQPTAGRTKLKNKMVQYYITHTFSEAMRKYAQHLKDLNNAKNHNEAPD